MIRVKVCKGAQELETFLNFIGWGNVLQVLTSEYHAKAPGDTRQIGAIYTVIFEDGLG